MVLKLLEENVPKIALLRGEDHVSYLRWLHLLAYSYEQNNQLDKAVAAHRDSVRLHEKKHGEGGEQQDSTND